MDDAELAGVEIRWPSGGKWTNGWAWVEPLLCGFQSRLKVRMREIPQPLTGTVVIEMGRAGRVYRVALNCSDYPQIIHLPNSHGTPDALDLEFKMQYQIGGYGHPNIVPGGFISDSVLVDLHARQPRRQRDAQQFSWDVYGRFNLQYAAEVRTAAVTALTNQSRVKFFGGGKKVTYREFLGEVARSRVCIDLPGLGPFCFRLVNYLAVGACIVSPPIAAEMPAPLEDRKHIVFTKPDMSDLVELCEQYANDAPAREALMQAGRDYYRRHLHWRSLSNYYLRTMLDRLPA